MEIVLETFFGYGSGVTVDLIGEKESSVVVSSDDSLYLIGQILCAVSEGLDVKITQYATKGDE